MSADVTHWRRAVRTPLRDLARGRITGSLDPWILATDAALPGALREIVRDTARRTRLFRRERVEVARELIEHFRDGLDAGRTDEELARSFGDTRTAARLIGRAKRRDRAVLLRMALVSAKATGVLVGLLMLVYIGLAVRHHSAKPGPIVDYLAILNAPTAAIPEDQRAWPVYREALLGSTLRQDLADIGGSARPGWRDWDRAVAGLRANAPALERVREGASRPALGMVLQYGIGADDAALWPEKLNSESAETESLMGVFHLLLPHTGELRVLASALALDCRLAREEGDAARTMANLEAMFGLASHARETPFLIGELVAMALAGFALETTAQTITEHPTLLSDADLARLAHRVGAFPDDGRTVLRLETERYSYYDFVQRSYSLDSRGDGRLRVKDPATGPVLAAISLSRLEAIEAYDDYLARALAWVQTPAWERTELDEDNSLDRSALGRLRYFVLDLFLPALQNAALQGETIATQRDATTVIIALELHRRRHGAWPASLGELVPALLPRVPLDPFDGGPLKYAMRDGEPVLYSIGNDFLDDGGAVPQGVDSSRFAASASRWHSRERVASLLGERATPKGVAPPTRSPHAWERAAGIVRGDWVFFPAPIPTEPPPRQRDPFAP